MKRLLALFSAPAHSAALALTGAAAALALTGSAMAQEAKPPAPMLIELFTSQGCSNCPKANALLGTLAKEHDVIALTYAVGYWDYLGWRDTFAKPEFTARQKSYAATLRQGGVYTPEMIVNGAGHASGSRAEKVRALMTSSTPPGAAHIAIEAVLERISPDKDVDGFHLYNVGGLLTGSTVFPPCTPYGVQKLLEHEKVEIAGRNVVVVGASNIVGKPTAMMLMQRDATVCICHKLTRDLAIFTLLADILVVAAGVPNLIVPQMVKTGAVVIDVGINRLPDGRLVGDVDFEGVRKKASLITPVPGGVGPMTITMLLHNTLISAERSVGLSHTD